MERTFGFIIPFHIRVLCVADSAVSVDRVISDAQHLRYATWLLVWCDADSLYFSVMGGGENDHVNWNFCRIFARIWNILCIYDNFDQLYVPFSFNFRWFSTPHLSTPSTIAWRLLGMKQKLSHLTSFSHIEKPFHLDSYSRFLLTHFVVLFGWHLSFSLSFRARVAVVCLKWN